MAKVSLWEKSRVSKDRTHHETIEGPLYASRFQEVLPFHSPGLAPAKEKDRWFHIKPDGTPAYLKTFNQAFGFYESRATVEKKGNWFHIQTNGNQAYNRRFLWCGNFQESLCTVRDQDGFFHHIKLNGENAYPEKYLYTGDFKEETAVAIRKDGQYIHIQTNGEPLYDQAFLQLGIYHKGYATAKDHCGWFHIDKLGNALYNQRYTFVEPFYNGLSLCIKMNGKTIRINTQGEEIEQVNLSENKAVGRKILL